jgi:hypothetical protein
MKKSLHKIIPNQNNFIKIAKYLSRKKKVSTFIDCNTVSYYINGEYSTQVKYTVSYVDDDNKVDQYNFYSFTDLLIHFHKEMKG